MNSASDATVVDSQGLGEEEAVALSQAAMGCPYLKQQGVAISRRLQNLVPKKGAGNRTGLHITSRLIVEAKEAKTIMVAAVCWQVSESNNVTQATEIYQKDLE